MFEISVILNALIEFIVLKIVVLVFAIALVALN